ncbi:hypothetical protein FOVG_18810 [Fusarium oxysporum f. sp. pisi HDV247]|uniref:Uncharacterized protein n=1 Tax=Fusarium oxysporum f. sp. pisi HDV247 TaxID=1080344 RepID=W9NAP6_FUSOX|nr:hypothetical protein FOVG_18810 [Fusarium oxysporum f. sp. pisi HDV247]
MEKVWFKLRQTDYPPPPEETILSGNGDDSNAPICLGHFIPDLKHLDFTLNSGSILAFPSRMRVFRTRTVDFKWDDTNDKLVGTNLAAGVPILAPAGFTVKASLQLAFKRTMANHEAYNRLDSYIVQPNRHYVSECLKRQELRAQVEGKAMWSIFMITGIRVARVGRRDITEGSFVVVGVGPEVDIPGIATATATINIDRKEFMHGCGKHLGDFVWAVRLAKVHKGLLTADWSVDPYTKRATFAAEDEGEVDVEGVLKDAGLEDFKVVDDEELDEAFVLDNSDWENI